MQGTLPLSKNLTPKARTAVVLPNLTSSSSVSLGQLFDDGCNINLDKEKMQVYKNNKLIMQGNRNKTDGLWDTPTQENYIPMQENYTPTQENYVLPKPLAPKSNCAKLAPESNCARLAPKTKLCNIGPQEFQVNKQPTKLTKHSISATMPTFMRNMDPIVENNTFDQILQEHNKLNVIIRKRQTKQQLATYLCATCLSPTPRTFT